MRTTEYERFENDGFTGGENDGFTGGENDGFTGGEKSECRLRNRPWRETMLGFRKVVN